MLSFAILLLSYFISVEHKNKKSNKVFLFLNMVNDPQSQYNKITLNLIFI